MEDARRDNKLDAQTFISVSSFLASPNDFRILWKGYNNKVKRNISETLLIRKHQPLLNIHENSVA